MIWLSRVLLHASLPARFGRYELPFGTHMAHADVPGGTAHGALAWDTAMPTFGEQLFLDKPSQY